MLRLRHSGTPAVDFFELVPESCGKEENSSAPDDEGIAFPPVTVKLSQEQLANLQQINVLEGNSDYGITLCIRVLEIIEEN